MASRLFFIRLLQTSPYVVQKLRQCNQLMASYDPHTRFLVQSGWKPIVAHKKMQQYIKGKYRPPLRGVIFKHLTNE